MTALKKTAETTAEEAAKTFDIEAHLSGFHPYQPPVKVHRNGALKVQIDDLFSQIEARKAELNVNGDEESLDDEAALDDDSLNDLIERHNDLVAKWEADVEEFRFRPTTIFDHREARDKATEAGIDLDKPGSMEDLYPYLWAQTVVQPAGAPVEFFRALRNLLGDTAVVEIQSGWVRTSNGGAGDPETGAPFLRTRLPSLTKAASSKS